MTRHAWCAATAVTAALAWPVAAQTLDPDDFRFAIGTLVLPTARGSAQPGDDAARLTNELRGLFRSPPGTDPALDVRCVPVRVDGLDNATYIEIARLDSPWAPFRQGVLHVYRRQGRLTLRLFDIGAPAGPGAGLRDALAGLWPAPDAMPALSLDTLTPNLDLAVTISGGIEKDITATSPHPFPTTRAGAIEATSMLGLWSHGRLLVLADRGFDADGRQVWGPGPREDARFTRLPDGDSAAATPAVHRLDGGLVTIDTVPGDGPGLESGGSVVLHYSFWLTDGTLIDSSRRAGREPLRTQVPGTPIKGFDSGMLGIAKGGRRRIVVPPDLAYGKAGARSNIPPDATLIFDVECLWLQNPVAPPTPTPVAPESPPADQPPTAPK
jgi:peptidylprolyl isomerase